MTEDYPWYVSITGNELRQGDILFDCPVIVPTFQSTAPAVASLDADILTYDVIVLSQSCDLEQDKLELVLVCPHWPLSVFAAKQEYFKSTKGKTDLQRGNVPGYHLLNRATETALLPELRVVDFRNVFSLPPGFLKSHCVQSGPRLRLLPPYREHLAQAFARFFMRVGLPIPVEFKE